MFSLNGGDGMKGTVYILEDDISICGLIKVALEMNGLDFKAFATVRSFLDGVAESVPDVCLIDIMLPDGSGLDALRAVKAKHPKVSVIMLSALGKEEDKVNALNLGADDYVTKPFSVLELTARVNARLRDKQPPAVITVVNVTLNVAEFTCLIDGDQVPLNRKEFELLKTFMLNPNRALTREKLLFDVWGYEGGETRTLDNHVARLRKVGVKIETVFGVGYKMVAL